MSDPRPAIRSRATASSRAKLGLVASTEECAGPWLTPGVTGIGAASFLADAGHEVPTAPLPGTVPSSWPMSGGQGGRVARTVC